MFSVLDENRKVRAERGGDRYEEALALAREADRQGFHAFWVAEHHFHDGGVLPAPAVWLAAAARETRRIRLGVMVSVLPLHAPRELAEQYLLVDRLSGGRLDLGVGSGYIPTELQGFGVLPSDKRERFDAAYPEFVAALEGRPLAVPLDPALTVCLNVSPVQLPHPPLWMAVQSRAALPFVAQRGLSVGMIPYASVDNLDELARNIREFRSALPEGAKEARVAAAFHVYVGRDTAPAREALERYLGVSRSTQGGYFQAKAAGSTTATSLDDLEKKDLVLLGDPKRVRGQLERIEAAGVTDFLGIFDFGSLDPKLVRGSVRAFARAAGISSLSAK